MSEIIYIVIIIILSPVNIDVIFNRVSIEEYKSSEIGWQSSKRIKNQKKEVLALNKEIASFAGNHHSEECYLNYSGKDGGWISQYMDISHMPTEMDVQEFSTARNIPTGHDEDIIRYCQDQILNKKNKKKKK